MREILELLERDAHLSHDTIATMTGVPVEQVAAQVAAVGGERGHPALHRRRRLGPRSGGARGRSPTRSSPRSSTSRSRPPAPSGSTTWRERISRFPEVRSVYLVSGGHDLRCTVTGRSIRAVSDFVSQKLSTIERVQATATHFVLKAYKRDGVAFAEPEPDHRLRVTP